ncbi:MAG: hypothetical protein IT437_00255 [Phycisphaerales bacterium]|nr:hypothetical protein [Phycisphaerales bacterium]
MSKPRSILPLLLPLGAAVFLIVAALGKVLSYRTFTSALTAWFLPTLSRSRGSSRP